MRRNTLALLIALLVLIWSAGCGGGAEDGGAASDDAAEAGEATDADAMEPAGSSAITGTINFTGTAPEPQPLDMDRECLEGVEGPLLSQNVVVNDNGTLKWAFVYVKEGLDGTFAAPSTPVQLDQENCRYEPHVFGVQTGQPINITNSDNFQHNIHALPEDNRPFNFSQPVQGMERETAFREQEIMVPIKCDVHPWMQAYAGVVDHPFFATSGDDGSFRIEGLPAGTYTIETWHEEYGTQTQEVTVGDGETATADFSYGGTASL